MAKTERYTVTTEIQGKTITGRYEVSDGLVTVFYGDHDKTTQIGGLSHDSVAQLLLGELARNGR